jgi:hypothetical protein
MSNQRSKNEKRRRTYYGVSLGILMLDSRFERFNGDIGNARTWPFPVQYKIVRGALPNKVVDTLNNRDLFQRFADAADELVADGVDGITTTCGFLALFQQELAAHCSVPVATSALLQVPIVARMLPKGKRPAILTFSANSLSVHHLAAVGIDPQTPVVGMPSTSQFQRAIREGDDSVPFEVFKDEVLDVAQRMIETDPSIGAIVCECTNITPYSYEINRRLGVPVFDMVTLVHWFHRALRPQHFPQD